MSVGRDVTEIGSSHVGAPGSPHAAHADAMTSDTMSRKVNMLAAKLGLAWCDTCADWTEIAGGSSATWKEELYGSGRGSNSMPTSAPPGF